MRRGTGDCARLLMKGDQVGGGGGGGKEISCNKNNALKNNIEEGKM